MTSKVNDVHITALRSSSENLGSGMLRFHAGLNSPKLTAVNADT